MSGMEARPTTGVHHMDAYLNFMTSVIVFWKNWIESTTQLGMGAVTAALMPKPRVFVRTLAPPGQ